MHIHDFSLLLWYYIHTTRTTTTFSEDFIHYIDKFELAAVFSQFLICSALPLAPRRLSKNPAFAGSFSGPQGRGLRSSLFYITSLLSSSALLHALY